MKRISIILLTILMGLFITLPAAHTWFKDKFKTIAPEKGLLSIPVKKISDGKAHYFQTRSESGVMVKFFLVKSGDGIIRAAIDACDVCFRSGKGYVQEDNVMVCTNCGMRFATDRINEVKGGCNPAPLERHMEGKNLIIPMGQINANAWLCRFKK